MLPGSPRGRWRGDRIGEIKLDAEAAVGSFTPQGIRKTIARNDLDGPDVRPRCRNECGGVSVGLELLFCAGARVVRITAVLRDGIFHSILVPVIVLESQARSGARHDPRSGSVLAEMKRNSNLARRARANVHAKR